MTRALGRMSGVKMREESGGEDDRGGERGARGENVREETRGDDRLLW